MVQQIMLALHCKKTDAVDLKGPIRDYIANTYSPEQVSSDKLRGSSRVAGACWLAPGANLGSFQVRRFVPVALPRQAAVVASAPHHALSRTQANDAVEDLEAIQGQRGQIVGMAGALPALRDVMVRCGLGLYQGSDASHSTQAVSLPSLVGPPAHCMVQVLPSSELDRDEVSHLQGCWPCACVVPVVRCLPAY